MSTSIAYYAWSVDKILHKLRKATPTTGADDGRREGIWEAGTGFKISLSQNIVKEGMSVNLMLTVHNLTKWIIIHLMEIYSYFEEYNFGSISKLLFSHSSANFPYENGNCTRTFPSTENMHTRTTIYNCIFLCIIISVIIWCFVLVYFFIFILFFLIFFI